MNNASAVRCLQRETDLADNLDSLLGRKLAVV
jgi:hypothetical protein